jgi:hypothetical protein
MLNAVRRCNLVPQIGNKLFMEDFSEHGALWRIFMLLTKYAHWQDDMGNYVMWRIGPLYHTNGAWEVQLGWIVFNYRYKPKLENRKGRFDWPHFRIWKDSAFSLRRVFRKYMY